MKLVPAWVRGGYGYGYPQPPRYGHNQDDETHRAASGKKDFTT